MHAPHAEAAWLDRKEHAAREEVRRGVVGLGDDLGSALSLPRSVRDHPSLRFALERTGQVLASDATLHALESSLIRVTLRDRVAILLSRVFA